MIKIVTKKKKGKEETHVHHTHYQHYHITNSRLSHMSTKSSDVQRPRTQTQLLPFNKQTQKKEKKKKRRVIGKKITTEV